MATREDFQSHWPKAGGISIPICDINDQISGNWTTPLGLENSTGGGLLYHYMGMSFAVLEMSFVILAEMSFGPNAQKKPANV